MENDPRALYNIVTIRNPDTEDFHFKVDNQGYSIAAGETRNFPKFMATLAVKHLIDKILQKKDNEGKLMSNKDERAALAEQIVVGEQNYEVPVIPTDDEIVEEMNMSDIDAILDKQKNQPQVVEKPKNKVGRPKKVEEFAGAKVPSRDEILKHAKNVLKIDTSDKKTLEAWDKLSDEALYLELGMDQ
jgi:hypothetical protein